MRAVVPLVYLYRVRRQTVLIAAGLGVCLCSCARPVPEREPYTISVPYGLDSLEPGARNRLSDLSLLSNVFEPLAATDANLSAHPALTVGWSTPDSLTWVFELRPGVRFPHGPPLTAEDVVWTLIGLQRGSRLEMSRHVSSFRSVRALDEKTLEIDTVVLVGIHLNELRFALHRAPEEALGDFLSSRSQFIQSSARSKEEALGREPDARFLRNGSVSVKVLHFNVVGTGASDVTCGRNPFLDVRVRRSVSLAIDRPELVRRPSVSAVPASQLVPPLHFRVRPLAKGREIRRRSTRSDRDGRGRTPDRAGPRGVAGPRARQWTRCPRR